jgi:hypothetical protein
VVINKERSVLDLIIFEKEEDTTNSNITVKSRLFDKSNLKIFIIKCSIFGIELSNYKSRI